MGNFDILESLRSQLDTIDNEILILLKRRFQTVKKVAEYKMKNNLDVYQPDREDEVQKKVSQKEHFQ